MQIKDTDFVLTVKNSTVEEGNRILDSGSTKHLLNDSRLLEDPEKHASKCVVIVCIVMGEAVKVQLKDFYYDESLELNIISYGMFEAKENGIVYRRKHRVIASLNGT